MAFNFDEQMGLYLPPMAKLKIISFFLCMLLSLQMLPIAQIGKMISNSHGQKNFHMVATKPARLRWQIFILFYLLSGSPYLPHGGNLKRLPTSIFPNKFHPTTQTK